MNSLSCQIRYATELDLQDAIAIEIEAFIPHGTAESEIVLSTKYAQGFYSNREFKVTRHRIDAGATYQL